MGFATHLGPWLLGTVRHTTGTAVGSLRNMGTTAVCQTKKKDHTATTTAGGTTTIAVLPAGAQIHNIFVDVLTGFAGSSLSAVELVIGNGTVADLYFPATALFTASATTGLVGSPPAGRVAIISNTTNLAGWPGAASTPAPDGIGVGATDVTVVATITPDKLLTAGLVQYTVVYSVRNSNGTSKPTAYTGP